MTSIPTYYALGLASVANGSATVTGTGTSWLAHVQAGDLFFAPGQATIFPVRIASVDSDTQLTLARTWPGTTLSGAAYEVQFVADGIRASERARQLVEELSEIDNTGIGIDAFGSLADRDAYDDKPTGYAFLSLDGDGDTITSPVVFLKASSADADWSDPIETQGPTGPAPNLTIGTITTVAPDDPADASITGTNPDYVLNLDLPQGDKGDRGWAIEPELVTDGIRRVLRVAGYVGGEGTEPTDDVGKYVGVGGLVTDVADAINIRGAQGIPGDSGFNWLGAWDSGANYVLGDVVTDDDADGEPAAWVSLTSNTNSQPKDNPSDWDFFPASFPATLDDGLITDSAGVTLDDGTIT